MLFILACLVILSAAAVGFIGGYRAGRYEGYGEGYWARANDECV
jgi:hypothetical protein